MIVELPLAAAVRPSRPARRFAPRAGEAETLEAAEGSDEIAAALRKGRLPIVTGGSGLYVQALLKGFSPVPDVGPLDRQRAQSMLKKQGNEKFHAKLAERDPETAGKLNPGDSQRMVRAMEVWFASGKPLSWWQSQPPEPAMLERPSLKVALLPDRDWLYGRCEERFVEMVKQGAIDEVMALAERGLDPELPLMKALGVKRRTQAMRMLAAPEERAGL